MLNTKGISPQVILFSCLNWTFSSVKVRLSVPSLHSSATDQHGQGKMMVGGERLCLMLAILLMHCNATCNHYFLPECTERGDITQLPLRGGGFQTGNEQPQDQWV